MSYEIVKMWSQRQYKHESSYFDSYKSECEKSYSLEYNRAHRVESIGVIPGDIILK